MESLRQCPSDVFADQMVAHCEAFSPTLCATIGQPRIRQVVRAGIGKARDHGFTHRGPARLIIELMFRLGSGFDTDPQLPWVRSILRGEPEEPQQRRAKRLFEAAVEYLAAVHGPEDTYWRRAIERLSISSREAPKSPQDELHARILGQLKRLYPEKYHYVGESTLGAIVDGSVAIAPTYGFATTHEIALIAALKLIFGDSCAEDPLYPWISETLHDDKLTDSPARARRLEEKALNLA